MNRKFLNNNNINIGTYYLAPYARTEAHIKAAAECGINFFVNIPNDATLLELLYQHGIGAIVNGIFPSWFGGDGSNAGQLAEKNPLTRYQEALAHYIDAPNIIGIDTGDEPSCLEFPHYGEIFSYIQKTLPHIQPYLNIYPSYAVSGFNTDAEIRKQLQCDTYSDYIEAYCQHVPSDYICFDYYLYSASLSGLYHSLITVTDACRKYEKNFYMVLQVNSHEPEIWLSTNKLRFQAFTAMAFGVDTIIWACYTAGWWHNHVLDKNGTPTEQYEKLKKVNSEIHFLGEQYKKYHSRETHFLGDYSSAEIIGENSFSTDFVQHLFSKHQEALLVNVMDSDSSHALFICASNDYCDKEPNAFSISFEAPNYTVTLFKNEASQLLVPDSNGRFEFHMLPNEGAFLSFMPS